MSELIKIIEERLKTYKIEAKQLHGHSDVLAGKIEAAQEILAIIKLVEFSK